MMISFRRIGNGSKLLLQKVDNYRSIIDPPKIGINTRVNKTREIFSESHNNQDTT